MGFAPLIQSQAGLSARFATTGEDRNPPTFLACITGIDMEFGEQDGLAAYAARGKTWING